VKIELAGERTYLADSMQFLPESGTRFEGRSCYYVMPSFPRRRYRRDGRLAVFHSMAEIVGGLDDVMEVVYQYLQALVLDALRHASALAAVDRWRLAPPDIPGTLEISAITFGRGDSGSRQGPAVGS
jgi:hypothetical protein